MRGAAWRDHLTMPLWGAAVGPLGVIMHQACDMLIHDCAAISILQDAVGTAAVACFVHSVLRLFLLVWGCWGCGSCAPAQLPVLLALGVDQLASFSQSFKVAFHCRLLAC